MTTTAEVEMIDDSSSVNLDIVSTAITTTMTTPPPQPRRYTIGSFTTPVPLRSIVAHYDKTLEREEPSSVNCEKARSSAREQAEEAQRSLDPQFPSFVKSLVKSHVKKISGGLWLRPPKNFCNSYLPKEDATINLVDKTGEICPVKYGGTGFTTGWKMFSNTHNLVEGDALIFQLVKPTEFQVHIFRAYPSLEVSGGITVRDSEAGVEQISLVDGFLPVAANNTEISTRAKTWAKQRAKEVQQSLDPVHPSFVKSMVRSHVSGGFWLGLPAPFCESYLSKNDVMVTLIDEKDEECQVKFKTGGFSAGWTGFSTAHDLVEGDTLVFQLLDDSKFKVYIIRAYNQSGLDLALGQQNSEVSAKRSTPRKRVKTCKTTEQKQLRTLSSSANDLTITEREESGTENGDIDSEASRIWENCDRKNFDIAVNDLQKNFKLSQNTWAKYYELCLSQKNLLHENLHKRHPNLVEGIISETVLIANGIKSSKMSTLLDDLATWNQSLEGFAHLGMNVGFLRAKLCKLENVISKSEEEIYLKRREEAITEHAHMDEEIRRLESEISEIKEASRLLDAELDNLKTKTGNRELKFQEEIDSPW